MPITIYYTFANISSSFQNLFQISPKLLFDRVICTEHEILNLCMHDSVWQKNCKFRLIKALAASKNRGFSIYLFIVIAKMFDAYCKLELDKPKNGLYSDHILNI